MARPDDVAAFPVKAREIGFPAGSGGGVGALLRHLQVWCDDQRSGRRGSLWAGSAAMLASVGLLIMFHQTLRGSVERAELRRAAMLLHSEAAQSCNALRGQRRREACLQQLNAEAANAAPGQALDAKLVSAGVQTRR